MDLVNPLSRWGWGGEPVDIEKLLHRIFYFIGKNGGVVSFYIVPFSQALPFPRLTVCNI